MPLPIAVTDTSVLIYLHHLGHLDSLSLFFREVLVPSPVRIEFLSLPDRSSREVALNVLTRRGLFSPCNDFDSIEVALFKQLKMHNAEAEALSQLKLRNADVLLIDERIGRKVAIREMRKVQGTLSIIVKLHKLGFIDYYSSVAKLRSEKKARFSRAIIREVYEREVGR